MSRKLTLLAAACAAACLSSAASAQSVSGSIRDAGSAPTDNFARDRAVTVRQRPRPEYDAIGVPVGAFTLFPRVQADLEYNDNIYATDTGEDGDVLLRLRPDLNLRSEWSRHFVSVFARASTSAYADNSNEGATDWTVGTSGRLDVLRGTNITAGADFGRLSEPRTSVSTPQLAREPIRYTAGQAYLAGAMTLNRLKLSSRLDYRKFNYDDGRAFNGALIEQDDRDREIVSLLGRADYAVSPDTALFVQVSGNERDYRDVPSASPPRDSSGYEALVGASFELGALIRGEIAAGYIKQEFDNAAYETIDGFGARGELEWLPTQLTTVTFTGSRTVEDAGIIGVAGYLSTQFTAQVDHELLRNLILTGTANYGQDDFDELGRTDERWGAGFSGTYLVNRNFGITLGASHASRSSDAIGGQNYDVNRLILTVVSQF